VGVAVCPEARVNHKDTKNDRVFSPNGASDSSLGRLPRRSLGEGWKAPGKRPEDDSNADIEHLMFTQRNPWALFLKRINLLRSKYVFS
jgi:hypothetical protein